MKKVTIISTSLRPGSNSNMLAEQFAEGAKATFSVVALAARKRLRATPSCRRRTRWVKSVIDAFEEWDYITAARVSHLCGSVRLQKKVYLCGE